MMRGGSNKSKDRISELPDAILTHILSFLDTKYAVQTSSLSKRWKTQWTSVTTLNFKYSSFRKSSAFRHFIEQVIFRRNSLFGLDKVVFLSRRIVSFDFYENVINYATANGVKHLQVCVSFNKKNLMSPVLKSVYISASLRTLKLESHQLINITTPFCSQHLEVLHLRGFVFSESNLLSKCENLVELSIICCWVDSSKELVISGPKISRLTMMNTWSEELVLSTPKLSEFCFEQIGLVLALQTDDELAFLTTVRIDLYSSCTISNVGEYMEWSQVLMDTVQKFRSARHVSLSRQVVELLYVVAGTMEIPPFSFPSLKTMTFIAEDSFDQNKNNIGNSKHNAPQICIPLNVLNQFSNHILRDSPRAKLLMEVRRV